MELHCPNCKAHLGAVTATARLILTVHCPFDGTDFGVAVEAPEVVVDVPPATNTNPPATP
jgi:hypothetical protein